ncbi:XdhC family protein [Microbacterium dextranolyticum]|uniref:XdhC/CoxI family protein n=1 Tax=Microbacterium dextranolyticum TaxID=36806 RepID=A0A9W6M697_9MICO|nr:XdhC/CoxI family protein [Microbacterium dextranolyticum]MBM7464388.1 xanthine dehydrogenase accessory factor [Microbacterium dextranolyticum]GLJ95385.1 XdhC/CoxI family protein [Microbacterium dextranolyticum]
MREILTPAAEWVRTGRPFAIATVIGVAGSAPRPVGASMIVSDAGVFGNVSGGCVEGAVYERCLDAIATGAASVESFGYSDGDGLAVGLTCGGSVDVLVRPVAPHSDAAAAIALLAERDAAAVPTRFRLVVSGPRCGTGLFDDRAADAAADASGAEWSVLIEVGTAPRLIVVGAVEFAVALAQLGSALGLRVSVVDPREVFATAERFPGAEVVVDWPDRYLATQTLDDRTAVCVLSHDPRLDVPALTLALRSPAGYVGAMGSRRTHDDRLRRLAEAGVSAGDLARLRSPIGLDLGASSAAETALSILAEIVADRHGGSGTRLSALAGPIHGGAARAAEGAAREQIPGAAHEAVRRATDAPAGAVVPVVCAPGPFSSARP